MYLSSAELLDLERAKLRLRGYDLSDCGRIVREALAVMLADLDAHGEDSLIVRRLREGRLREGRAREGRGYARDGYARDIDHNAERRDWRCGGPRRVKRLRGAS